MVFLALKVLLLTLAYRIPGFCFSPLSNTPLQSIQLNPGRFTLSVLQPLLPQSCSRNEVDAEFLVTITLIRNLYQLVVPNDFLPIQFLDSLLGFASLFALWTGHPIYSFIEDPDSLSTTALLHSHIPWFSIDPQ